MDMKSKLELKIFLALLFLIIGNQAYCDILIQVDIYPYYYEMDSYDIPMMKGIAEREWALQNEKGVEQKDYYNIGLKQFSAAKYDDCIKSLELAKTYYGNKDHIYHLMGLAYLKKQDYINAIKCFNIAINVYKLETSQIYYERGLARYYIKDYEGAIEDFKISEDKGLNPNETKIVTKEFLDYKTIINNTDYKELYPLITDINLANYFVVYPMYNTAIKLTNIADIKNIDLCTDEKIRKDRAKAYKLFNENLSKDDIEKYDEILTLNPCFMEAYNNRSILNLKNKNYTNAIKDLENAFQINPNYKDVIYNLALSYYSNKDYNNAILYIDKYFQLDNYIYKKSSLLNDFIGGNQLSNNEKFRQYFIAKMIKANSLLLTNKISEAKIIFNQFNTIYPLYYMGNGLVQVKEKNYKKAIKAFENCLQFEYETKSYNDMEYKEKSADYVSNAYIYNNIAIAEYLKGNYSSAYTNIKKAAYLSFLNNNIVLYSQIVTLKNLIKSKLIPQDEIKANKDYNKFYFRNKNAIEIKEKSKGII